MTDRAMTSASDENAFVHAALLYRDTEQLRVAVRRFVGDAVAAGEPLLAVLPSASLQLLGDVLDDAGGDQRREDMADAGRNPSRVIPMLVDWLDGCDGRARVISEPLWPGRSDAEAAECLRHEALMNHALATTAVSVLCPYDVEHLAGELIAGAEMTHPRVIDHAGVRASRTYGEPLDVARGEHWPQAPPTPPVSELAFDGDLWALRHSLAEDALLAGMDPTRREDLVFAVNEVASNAVRHGDGRCHARVWRDGDSIVSEIRATSAIDDPLAGRRRPEIGATGGRGLWLINQVCDLVELRSDGDGSSVRVHVAMG